jgi:HJR/Mrr/RecB family endonuclease
MFVPQDARIFSKYQELEVQKAKKIDECNQFRESLFIKISELTEAQKRHSELSELLRKKQIQASKEYRRQQLLKRDWKSLRSVPFENYLEEVFKELGYSVETTKITGDQGADLIVSNCGHKIAIQIKGYFSSVSNGAVQEAFTSKGYYSCEACAVITNSHFTASAKDLANRIGCVLIDEDMLPALVLGNYDLWQQHLLVMSQPKIKLTD